MYKLPEQNKLNKTACLKMHFMSRVFSNTTSLMTSVCMLYVGAMAASSYLSEYADKLLKGENQSTQIPQTGQIRIFLA